MKKLLCLLAAVLLLPLAACAPDGPIVLPLPGGVIEALSGDTLPLPPTGTDDLSPLVSVETKTVTLTPAAGLTATLRVPVFSGLPAKTAEKLNAALEKKAEDEFFARVQPPETYAVGELTADYRVTSCEVAYPGGNLVSVLFLARAEYTAYDREFRTPVTDGINYACSVVMDLSTGSELPAAGLFSDFGAVLDLLADGAFSVTAGAPCSNLPDLIAEARTNAAHGVLPPFLLSPDELTLVFFSNDGDEAARYSVPVGRISQTLTIPPKK